MSWQTPLSIALWPHQEPAVGGSPAGRASRDHGFDHLRPPLRPRQRQGWTGASTNGYRSFTCSRPGRIRCDLCQRPSCAK
jgi:hypothetical protein